jgi:hypothetical protein
MRETEPAAGNQGCSGGEPNAGLGMVGGFLRSLFLAYSVAVAQAGSSNVKEQFLFRRVSTE